MRTGNWRRGAAGVALVCHLLTAFGFPIPVPPGRSKSGSIRFPCQDRPCGCPTSDECWKGDCCCFTLEEKLRWAEENGVEPPGHVRSLVESRASRAAPKMKSCCAGAEPAPADRAAPDCAARAATAGCSPCDAESAPPCDREAPSDDRSGVRWAAVVFAQKCRGDGPAGSLELEPVVAPDRPVPPLAESAAAEAVVSPTPRAARRAVRPPTPPPRLP